MMTTQRRLEDHHLDDLVDSGISEKTMRAARLYSASRNEVHQLLGFDARSGGLVFLEEQELQEKFGRLYQRSGSLATREKESHGDDDQ